MISKDCNKHRGKLKFVAGNAFVKGYSEPHREDTELHREGLDMPASRMITD